MEETVQIITDPVIQDGVKTVITILAGSSASAIITVFASLYAVSSTVASIYCRFTKTKDTKFYKFLECYLAHNAGKAKDLAKKTKKGK